MKKPQQRTPFALESAYDEKLSATHAKHVYSFTTEEKARLMTVDEMKKFLLQVAELQSNTIVVEALTRIGKPFNVQTDSIVFDTISGTCVVYTPTHAKK